MLIEIYQYHWLTSTVFISQKTYRYKCSSLINFQKKGPHFFAQFLIPGKFRAFKTILNQICVLLVVDELRPPGGSLWGGGDRSSEARRDLELI